MESKANSAIDPAKRAWHVSEPDAGALIESARGDEAEATFEATFRLWRAKGVLIPVAAWAESSDSVRVGDLIQFSRRGAIFDHPSEEKEEYFVKVKNLSEDYCKGLCDPKVALVLNVKESIFTVTDRLHYLPCDDGPALRTYKVLIDGEIRYIFSIDHYVRVIQKGQERK